MIVFKNIWKSYRKELFQPAPPALHDISFALGQGQTLGLIGANGAGKSTCIKLLMDFIRPDQGSVSLLSSTPQDNAIRSQIGYLPETANFPANLTVLDMLRFTGQACHMPQSDIRIASEKWLCRLGLWEARKKPLRNYSKGMQQRANFAIALLNTPQLLILDEPMSGLDPIGRADILALIAELKSQHCSILFCSHILEDVDRLVDSVLLLHKGKKLFHGTPEELAASENTSTMAEAFVRRVKREDTRA
ncbi:MAG: ABC transporter [Desulfobulbaceae bacterium A2]|nr:MAG: ABC transporter [Desulfobulbaceae bacterium A2]